MENRRPRLADNIRLEIGQILHEKTMTMQEVMTKYDIGESVAYKALQTYRETNGLKKSKVKHRAAALLVSEPHTVSDLKSENLELQHQLRSAHEEIVVLQKILMVVGRTL